MQIASWKTNLIYIACLLPRASEDFVDWTRRNSLREGKPGQQQETQHNQTAQSGDHHRSPYEQANCSIYWETRLGVAAVLPFSFVVWTTNTSPVVLRMSRTCLHLLPRTNRVGSIANYLISRLQAATNFDVAAYTQTSNDIHPCQTVSARGDTSSAPIPRRLGPP
jgi:hypothetical protein